MEWNIATVLGYGFLAVAGIQLFYYLFFFSRLAFCRIRQPPDAAGELPPLSVVICAKDEQRNLSRNLPAVLQQRYHDGQHEPRYEVVVVNDNSDDETVSVLKYLQPGYAHFRFIDLQQSAKGIPGKKYPLTVGIKGARFEHVVLTDADCRPATVRWLAHVGAALRGGKDLALGYGAYEKMPGFLNKVIRYETFFSALQYLSFALAGVPYMGVGRNLAYRKELFFRHRGFLSHGHLPSGDDDLFINAAATRRNTAVVLHPDAHTISAPKRSWGAWYRQKTRHMTTGRHYKAGHQFLLGLFSLSQALYYPALAAALWAYPGRLLLLSVLAGRMLLQGVIWWRALRRLNERDLFWWCWIMDIAMIAYYIIFMPALWRKPAKQWN